MGLKIHYKWFTLHWNTKNSCIIKEERKLHRHLHEQAGRFGEQSNHKGTAPCSHFPQENQQQGHQRIYLALL